MCELINISLVYTYVCWFSLCVTSIFGHVIMVVSSLKMYILFRIWQQLGMCTRVWHIYPTFQHQAINISPCRSRVSHIKKKRKVMNVSELHITREARYVPAVFVIRVIILRFSLLVNVISTLLCFISSYRYRWNSLSSFT